MHTKARARIEALEAWETHSMILASFDTQELLCIIPKLVAAL